MRFIPTPVGNIPAESPRIFQRPVHPHACGEHTPSANPSATISGSSPRLWGTSDWRPLRFQRSRFIPTPVGNIIDFPEIETHITVHPHACGEHPCLTFRSHTMPWFIPTPVGNILTSVASGIILPVHPHACGEHAIAMAPVFIIAGSSPRLWGTYRLSREASNRIRFIPTPVGNINAISPWVGDSTVHPHACGEHFIVCSWIMYRSGSSPRLWGTCVDQFINS